LKFSPKIVYLEYCMWIKSNDKSLQSPGQTKERILIMFWDKNKVMIILCFNPSNVRLLLKLKSYPSTDECQTTGRKKKR
jgi:hypothetical protein